VVARQLKADAGPVRLYIDLRRQALGITNTTTSYIKQRSKRLYPTIHNQNLTIKAFIPIGTS
jgi:hypothetical protein